MKRLPDAELEIMMIIWRLNRAVTRLDIEENLQKDRQLSATTILSFLARLEERGFLKVEKEGKSNLYTAVISEQEYLQSESRSILSKLYRNSIRNFMAALYDGDSLSEEDMEELREFIDEKTKGQKRDKEE